MNVKLPKHSEDSWETHLSMLHGDYWDSLRYRREKGLTTSAQILASCVPASGGASEEIPINGSDHLHS